MKLTAKPVARVKINATGFSLEGIVNHQTIPNLIEKLPQVESESPVLDISAVTRIDSAGLAFLIDWGKKHLPEGQKVLLSGTSQQTRQLIETMKLDALFEQQVAE